MMFFRLKRSFFAVLISVLIAVAIPFGSFAGLVNADSSEYYFIDGYCTADNVTDFRGDVIPGFTFCLDRNKGVPSGSNIYRRMLLSENTDYTDEEKRMMLTIANDPAGVEEFINQLAQTSECVRRFVDKYHLWYNHEHYEVQEILWSITFRKTYGSEFLGSSTYNSWASDRYFGGASDDPLNDPDSLWNQLYVPVYQYLIDNCPGFEEHDVYLYNPDNTYYQPMLSTVFTRTTVTLEKSVLDLDDNPYSFNGEDDNGFEVSVTVVDPDTGDAVADHEFTLINSDGSTSSVTTDSTGLMQFTLNNGESIRLRDRYDDDFLFYVRETAANLGNDCTFERVDASTSVTVENEDSIVTVNNESSNIITVVNRYDYMFVQTTETTATETTAPTESSSESSESSPSSTESSAPSETTAESSATESSATESSATESSATDPSVTETSATNSADENVNAAAPTQIMNAARHAEDEPTTSSSSDTSATTATPTPTPATVANAAAGTSNAVTATGEAVSGSTIAAYIVLGLSLVTIGSLTVLSYKKKD